MTNKTETKNIIFLGLFALGIYLFTKENCPIYINFIGMFIAGFTSIRFI